MIYLNKKRMKFDSNWKLAVAPGKLRHKVRLKLPEGLNFDQFSEVIK
jgi:hypothetical protein